MSYNYTLKYRTFDQLISSVAVDFYKNQLEGTINPQELMKVARRINYDLGLRIMMTKETLLEVEKGRVKLPDDFSVLNYAMICDEVISYQQMPQGTNIQDIKVFPKYQETNANIDLCTPSVVNCNPVVSGCSCSSGNSCSGSCGCNCSFCQNPAFDKICETPLIDTTHINTSVTTTVTTTIQTCTWAVPKEWTDANYTIVINSITYNVGHTISTLQATLNALGLGTFTVIFDGLSNDYIITVIGDETYGIFTSDLLRDAVAYPSCITTNTTTNTITNTDNTQIATTNNCCAVNPDPCNKPRVVLNCKGEIWEVVQVVNTGITNTFKRLMPLKIKQNGENIDCGCPNLYMTSANEGWIENGFLRTNFDCAKVYINYQGDLVDDDNNIMVPDHPGLNDYYEYSIKKRIVENLMMNDEAVGQKLQYINAELRTARIYALTIVNTPNFAEMKALWWANRKVQYAKYYDMFKSYTWYQWDRNPNLDMMNNPGR